MPNLLLLAALSASSGSGAPIGTVWVQTPSWNTTAWAADTWADIGSGGSIPVFTYYFSKMRRQHGA
jgi:hypothetical protein